MSNDSSTSSSSDGSDPKFNLEDRTARFGESVIRFAKRLPVTPITDPMIRELVRASTSVGANDCEADDAGSRKEFRHRISLCKRESCESKHWLRMIAAAIEDHPDLVTEARGHWQESKELNLIFATIHRNSGKD